MGTLIIYTIALLVSIAIICISILYLRKIEDKSIFYITALLTSFFISAISTVFIESNKILDATKVSIVVPNGFYSDIQYDSINNPISDEILYNYLKTMRVPHADIIVAQAHLESQNFTSNLFKRQNNFLGMKIPRQRISTTGQGKGEYKDYTNWQECTTDYIFWMHHHQAHKLNRDEYFNLLGKIYAEDPEYVKKLKGIISKFKFK